MLSTVSHRKGTSHHRSSRSVAARFKNAADHSRPVIHDVQPHALGTRRIFCNSLTVIFYQQFASALFGCQLNQDFAWFTVLDRIIHCFLSDVIEMCSHRVIVNQDRCFTLKAA